MAPVFYFPLIGTPTAEGNQLWFYEAGLDVPLDVWQNTERDIPWAQPIVLNAAGESDGPIYVSDSPSYKVVYKDSNGVPIPGYPVDFVAPSTIINVTQSLIVSLTNAQIKALPTTPITIVPAPASGLRVKVLGATAHSACAAGAYTNINATYAALAIYYLGNFTQWATVGVINDSTPTSGALTNLTTFFSTQPRTVDLINYVETPSFVSEVQWTLPNMQLVSDTNGIALAIAIDNNGSGALTGGNAANTLTVTVYYALESVV